MDTMGDVVGQVLGDGRFELVRQLGEGGQGRTFLARDLGARDLAAGGRDVVVKELLLGRVGDWKSVELFEREGKALRNVRHAQVPAYVDAFVGADDGRFYLVQELVEGEDLQTRIDDGMLMDEEAALDFLEQMLGVLGYLHGLSPPVIHRDLKPSNVMRRFDGTYMLIDFGAVQSVISDRMGGSTVVGTTGYMAPEQLMGRASASSDLYGLAATVVHAVVGMQPSDLPMVRLRLDFRELAGLSGGLSDVLERMLAPDARERFGSAADVLAALAEVRSVGELLGEVRSQLPGCEEDSYRPSAKMLGLLQNKPVENGLCAARIEKGALRIEIDTSASLRWGTRVWWMSLMVAIALGLLVLMLGLLAVATTSAVVSLIGLIRTWRMLQLRAARDVLTMGPDGIEILKYRLDGSVVWEKSLAYEEIDRMYVDYVGKHTLENRHGGRGRVGRSGKSPGHGMVWVTHRRGRNGMHERYLVGNEALSRLQKVAGGSVDLSEFEWMDALVTRYWAEAVADESTETENTETVTLDFGVKKVAKEQVKIDARG